jgi:hypothetical protein
VNPESPPEDIDRVVRPLIRALLGARFPDRDSADDVPETSTLNSLEYSTPIPVVHVGRGDLRDGKSLDDLRTVGWRQLVRQGGHPVALSEAVSDPTEGTQLTQLNYGPVVESLANELARPGRSVDTFDGHVRFLQIPALYTLALWYQGTKENFVVPLSPAPEPLEGGREYPVNEFLTVVRQMEQEAHPHGPALR